MFMKMKFLRAPEGDPGTGGTPLSNPPPTTETVSTPPASAPSGAATQALETAAEQLTTKTGKVVPLSQSTIDKLKKQNREKGKKDAQSEFDAKAKSLGYGSAEEMFLAIEKQKKQAAPAPKPKQQPGKQTMQAQGTQTPNRSQRKDDRRERENRERFERERRERIRAQKRAADAQREAWAAEAMGELKVMAIGVGIKDPEYATALLTRHCEQQRNTMSESDYEKWVNQLDERAFFESLRKTRPALFQEEVVLPTTGNPGGNAPPKPTEVLDQQTAGKREAANAKNMTREQYSAELRRRGLTVPTL